MRLPITKPIAPIELVLHEDVLSAWCWIAERRIAAVADELSEFFAPLGYAPYPLRPEPRAPSEAERRNLAREVRRAARQPEGRGLGDELWVSPDPPTTSVTPLVALAAARLQGCTREAALRQAMREAAFRGGLNVSRSDIILELAHRAGLDMARFTGALAAPATERAVREEYRMAVEKGVEELPALVVGDEWLVSGLRSVEEYRSILTRYVNTRVGIPIERSVH